MTSKHQDVQLCAIPSTLNGMGAPIAQLVTNHSVPGRSLRLAPLLPKAPFGAGPRRGRARGDQDTATSIQSESGI